MQHALTSTAYRGGLWTWYCKCGHISEGWTSKGNAIDGWHEHLDGSDD